MKSPASLQSATNFLKRTWSAFLRLPPRTRTLIIVLTLIAGLAALDIAMTVQDNTYFGEGDPESAPLLTVSDASVVGWGSSKRKWKLTARKIYLIQDARKSIFKDVEGATLYREGEPVLMIRAKEIQLDMMSHNFEARGMIEIDYRAMGSRFYATRLRWDAKSERIVTKGGISIKKNDMMLKAGDMQFDIKSGKVRFDSLDIFF